ncbi:hypothetical protein ABW19_dt0200523 [Dactylella cylindrospora]|nr:hypothetical protein ABW19_dt0200523 [Dactylella cylindrospora]
MMKAHVAQSTAQQAIAMQNQAESADSYGDPQKQQQSLPLPQPAGEPTIQQQHSTADSASAQNKKRKHDNEDDGPPSRRTSFQRTPPSTSLGLQGAGFMPVNNSTGYGSLTSPQHNQPPSESINGVSSAEHQLSQMGSIIQQMAMPQQSVPASHLDTGFGMLSPQHDTLGHAPTAPAPAPLQTRPSHVATAPITKPQVGSEEWHRVRKDNHKEVERRRRETINEGINELAKIVPGCEKNKGSILQRTVQYIHELTEELKKVKNDKSVEKMLTDQAMRDLSNANDKLKAECERAWREAETWKKVVTSGENSNNNNSNNAGNSSSNAEASGQQ